MNGLTKLLGSSTAWFGIIVNVAYYAAHGTLNETLMELALGVFGGKEAFAKLGAALPGLLEQLKSKTPPAT